MAINIHANVAGIPNDLPTLHVDNGALVLGDLSVPGRCTFALIDGTPPHGAWVTWDQGTRTARTIIARVAGQPLPPGDYESSSLAEPIPTLDYGPAVPTLVRLTTSGDQFLANGERWVWRGATDLRLFQRWRDADPLAEAVVEQRKACGANLVRVLAMKANNTGWELKPDYPDEVVHGFFRWLAEKGMYCEWTVFADTRALMPWVSQQDSFWVRAIGIAADHPHVLLELVNEAGHSTQALNPSRFTLPDGNGVLASHGSGLTDADVVRPTWSYATYHGRRDRPPDLRGACTYDHYEFQAQWKPCPFICDEGCKPEDYGHDPAFAALMGKHANVGSGGTFHSGAGVDSRLWGPHETPCATAFYKELGVS